MKWYLLFLVLFTGCVQDEHWYTAMSCNRDECASLMGFSNPDDCFTLIDGIHKLHVEVLSEKPARVMFCKDENGAIIDRGTK